MNKSAKERFWSKVQSGSPDECWKWMGAHDTCGYGNFWDGERYLKAHQFSYHVTFGFIPKGFYVCHICDNPPCVNPRHLFLGTAKDNCTDKEEKGRDIHPKGILNHAKLTEKQVETIRAEYIPWIMSKRKLARKYGVGMTTIHAIIHRLKWKHI